MFNTGQIYALSNKLKKYAYKIEGDILMGNYIAQRLERKHCLPPRNPSETHIKWLPLEQDDVPGYHLIKDRTAGLLSDKT